MLKECFNVRKSLLQLLRKNNKHVRWMSFSFNQARPKQDRAYILLLLPAASFGLGIWQIRRRQWKLDLIKDLEERTLAPSVPFPEDLEELKRLEYCSVDLEGEFDNTREVYIGPRSLIDRTKEEQPGRLLGSSSQSGIHVVTPFKLKDRDLTILVNRGWIPRKYMHAKEKPGQVNGPVSISGLVRHTQKRQPFGAKNPCQGLEWQRRDIELISDELGTDPYFIDADSNSTVPNGPVGGQTRVTMRNEHLSYIFTWFSLGGATSWMWYTRFGRIR